MVFATRLRVGVHVFAKALALLLFAATPAFAQRVQSASNSCSWTKSCIVPFSSNLAAGDAVAVAIQVGTWETGPQTPVVADSQGNTYAPAASVASTFLFCAQNVSAGPNSVSSSLGLAQNQALVILEFRGSCTVDQSTTASGSSASAATSAIPVHAVDFLVAAASSHYSDTFQPSAGFTVERGPGTVVIADSPQNTNGNTSVTFTLGTSTAWNALLVAFGPSSSPTTTFSITATLTWDDGTPVAGTVSLAQETSTNPVSLNSLGSFALNSTGVAQGSVTINLSLPLTFFVTLVNPSGAVVNSMTFFANSQMIQGMSRTLNPSIVLAKADASIKSITF